LDIDTCVSEIRHWCNRQKGRWLFVFDSADDIDVPEASSFIDLWKFIPDTASADVIITTRS